MSLRKDLLKQVLAWAETQLGVAGSGAAPSVILAQRAGKSPRPPLPYLVLHFTAFDTPIGVAETRYAAAEEDGTKQIGAHRQATLEIRGMGPESDDWLAELALRVDTFDGDMTIIPMPGSSILDVSALVDESIQEMYIREFLCEYHVRTSETIETATTTTLTVGDVDETYTTTIAFPWE